jgi:hypothetical protein
MCSAGLKVRNFQARREPIRLLSISIFQLIVRDELAMLQQRAAARKTAETRITYGTLLAVGFYLFCLFIQFFKSNAFLSLVAINY